MKPLTVLVVDDEPLARDTLTALVVEAADVTLLGACADGEQARQRILAANPDIVLLDIEMPGMRGVDLLDALPESHRPVVVFVTAYDAYAVRAFELEAADYLLKPFSDRRFFEVLERAKRRVLERRMSTLALQLAGSNANSPAHDDEPGYLQRIPIKRRGRQMLIPVADIRWIESDDYCARLHTSQGRFLLRGSLATLEERLDPAVFLRVHRSAIVRLDAVTEIRPRANGGRVLKLADDELIPVSRARVKAIEAQLLPHLGR